jgi:hypothetical protein
MGDAANSYGCGTQPDAAGGQNFPGNAPAWRSYRTKDATAADSTGFTAAVLSLESTSVRLIDSLRVTC